jgi:acyl-CoA synthetase (AMP-forming)/AMP-acid ligase II
MTTSSDDDPEGVVPDWSAHRAIEECAYNVGIPFVGLVPSPRESGIFALFLDAYSSSSYSTPLRYDDVANIGGCDSPRMEGDVDLVGNETRALLSRDGDDGGTDDDSSKNEPNGPSDEVLVLFTSGTTGNKKLVPHVMGDMLTASAIIALSWDLSPSDVNCNLMPLFHVGGIVRQVFSPIFSGGCVICCPAFDTTVFWSLLSNGAFTWYYAAPTMHQLILQTGKMDGHIDDDGDCSMKLRMIANAAGGLLPSLAREMSRVFDATVSGREKLVPHKRNISLTPFLSFSYQVLPSYGMTECMPITSPPSTYRLDKAGTSGVSVGPELAILDVSTLRPMSPGEEGPICVRGEPCFRGYGKIAADDGEEGTEREDLGETFLEGGWFNTGDLGYLDEDGYLYITGRSKEVINRGGEIISPMEVEEAVMVHPDVSSCAAFSAPHDVLQEVVGIVIVMGSDRPRLDLPSLHVHLGEHLAPPKWPQCIVFMDSLPKSHTNKLLRVKLGSRLRLPELSDDMNTTERTFEAVCPPQGTSLDIPIQARRVSLNADDIERQLYALLSRDVDQRLAVVPHRTRANAFVCYLVNIDRTEAIKTAIQCMARYSLPSHFVETDETTLASKLLPPPNMTDAVATILQEQQSSGPSDSIVQGMKNLFTDLLGLDYIPGPDANFFHLGGSSMLASQLASKIRKLFAIACNGSEVFQHASSNEMAKLIRTRQRKDASSGTGTTMTKSVSDDCFSDGSKSVSDHDAPFKAEHLAPESSCGASLFQLVPMFIVFPVWQVSRYLLFFYILLWSINNVPGDRDLGRFVAAYIAFHAIWITITPLIFVAMKWIIIGRYKPGRYPIWGSYYLRWWFVDVMRKLFLRGIWGSNDVLLNTYYRMLGAKIGKGAHISLEADVAEFDLVEVGEGAAVELSTLRGFGVDNGAMILGPVKVGKHGSLGIKSIVAPYTSIPNNCHLGPVTSTYDVKALDATNARVNRKCFPGPPLWMQLCIIGPITFLVNAFAQLPPLLVLFKMLEYKGKHDAYFSTLSDLIEWLMDPHRIQYYIGIRVARALFSPFFYMAAALFVKKVVIGRFNVGPRDTSDHWQLLRHSLSATLFSRKKIQNVTDLIGRHYELVSVLYRLLGAKVGKRGE